MKKQIKSLLPLTVLLLFHILACGFLVFIEPELLMLVLVTVWFWMGLAAGLFYWCGTWAERHGARTMAGRALLAFVSGLLYCGTFPFFMSLEEFLEWGHWRSFAIALTRENMLFFLVPFLLSFVPCLIGQSIASKQSFEEEKR